jgi:hypothetical protein
MNTIIISASAAVGIKTLIVCVTMVSATTNHMTNVCAHGRIAIIHVCDEFTHRRWMTQRPAIPQASGTVWLG